MRDGRALDPYGCERLGLKLAYLLFGEHIRVDAAADIVLTPILDTARLLAPLKLMFILKMTQG